MIQMSLNNVKHRKYAKKKSRCIIYNMPSCEQALKQVEDINKQNADIQAKYEEDKQSYSRWLQRKNNWINRTGPYEKWKKYDGENREFWAKETDGTCWAGENWNAANDWCHQAANKKGYDGENYWAKQWGWCDGRWGNFKCAKDDNVVKDQRNDYQADIPTTDEKTGKYWLNKDEPIVTYLPVPNISCCQDMGFKNINASDVKFDNLSQSCYIKGEATSDIKPKLNSNTLPTRGIKPKPTSPSIQDNSSMYIIIFLIIVCILFVSSILVAGGIVLSSK